MTNPPTRFDDRSRWHLWVAFLLYLAFVVYGSLVPFEYRVLAWDQAVAQFPNIRLLDLDVVSRADWIANIVLYVPLAFLGCSALLGVRHTGWPVPVGVVLVGLFCLATAVAVEFTQQWFSPRTVSLNDLIAESIGTLIGLSLWVFGRAGIARLVDAFMRGGRPSLIAALVGYGLIYLALSLFPYDFVLSAEELRWKLESGNQGWLVASACGGLIRCSARLSLDVLASVPLGLIGALLWPRRSLIWFFAVGALIGLVLEPLQLLLASGTSQGASVLLRGVGLVTGALAGAWLRRLGPRPVAQVLALGAPLLAVPYVAGLALVSGWFSVPALSVDSAMARLSEVRWLPLYYHYYTTEPVAMASSLAKLALYAPLGLWAWSSVARRDRARGLGGPWLAAATALALSPVIEFGKLFFPPKHPDPTNWALALAGALIAYGLARWLERVLAGGGWTAPVAGNGWDTTGPPLLPRAPERRSGAKPLRGSTEDPWTRPTPEAAWVLSRQDKGVRKAPVPTPDSTSLAASPVLQWVSRFFGLGIAGVVLWLLSKYPVAPIPLALVLGVYAAALVRWPRFWLIVIPAVVPTLDLVPWSGWFYWESVDFFLAVTLMVPLLGSWRTLPPVPLPGAALVALLALSYAVSLVHGLLPPTPLDANAFSNYWSPYNALRVAKGFVWALLLLPVARVTLNDRAAFRDFLFPGLILGFLGVMTVLIYERQVFSGLLNFSNQFRVTASFSSMHTGGGHIEAYLSLVLPFILAYLLSKRAPWVSLAAAPLLALAGYGLAVSFARAALLGLGVGLAIMTLGVLIYSRTAHGRHRLRLAATLGLGLVALFAVALPIVKGDYFKERLGQVERDLETRTAHWSGAVNMMTPGAGTVLLGMGLGTFPVTYLLAQSASTRPATFRFVGTDQGRFLNLTAGDSLYYEQIVRILPHRTYRLAMDLRTRNPAPGLTVPICAKSLLYSYDCKWLGVPDIRGDGNWHRYQVDFDSGELGAGPWYSRRPTKLSLYSTTGGEGIDIDNIQLVAVDGVDLVRNGDFAQANAHWFFSTDNHLPWHVKDLWVAIYFEQGLLGVAAFLLFSGFVLLRLNRIVLGGDVMATGFLAGLAGFLAVGLFDSMFDAPRLTFLFYFVCFAALLLPKDAGDRR